MLDPLVRTCVGKVLELHLTDHSVGPEDDGMVSTDGDAGQSTDDSWDSVQPGGGGQEGEHTCWWWNG